MKPWKTLERAAGPDGQQLLLQERDGKFVIRIGGQELMSSARHSSEEAMAEVGLPRRDMRAVLIGGLGMGYTLRATLDRLPADACVVVAELLPAIVEWNRGPLGALANRPLADPRVTVELDDVLRVAAKARDRFDAILLDVDNGPQALTQKANQRLYGASGIEQLRDALRPGGMLVVWSAGPSPSYLDRLSRAGLDAEDRAVPAHGRGGTRHTLFVARRR